MVPDLRGEADRVQGEALEGEQAEGLAEWEARDPVQAQGGTACVPAAEILLLIKQDFPATSGAVPNAVR